MNRFLIDNESIFGELLTPLLRKDEPFLVVFEVEMLTKEQVIECNTMNPCCWCESGVLFVSVTILFSGKQIVIIQSEGERPWTGHEAETWWEALASPKANPFHLFSGIHRQEKIKQSQTQSKKQTVFSKCNTWNICVGLCLLPALYFICPVCPLQLCNPSLCAPPLSCSRSWGLQEAAVCWHSWDVARSLIPTLGEIRLSCSPSCSCNFDQALMWLGSDPDMTGLATWKRSSEGRWGVVVERLDLTSKPREERNYSEGVFRLLLLCLVGNEGFMYSFFLGKYCDL